MLPKIDTPFSTGWIGWELEGYRACDGTYCWFAYETLPPLHNIDPTFTWLIPERQEYDRSAARNSEHEVKLREIKAQENAKLARLMDEAKRLGLKIPDSFVNYMPLWGLIGGMGCNYSTLADHLIPCPGFPDAYLLGFVRDYQECETWALCLTQTGEHCVMVLTMDAVDAMPEHLKMALHGDMEWWDGETLTSEEFFTSTKVAAPTEDIFVCAPTFEEFVYRFWLEDAISQKLGAKDKTTLTEPQRRYLMHYAYNRAK